MSRKKTVETINNKVEELSYKLKGIGDRYVLDATHALDMIMETISLQLKEGQNIDDTDLQGFILDLANNLYFASDMQEQLGIKEDVAKMIRQELYNQTKKETAGTVAEKEAAALLDSKYEETVQLVYARAYKRVKVKVEAGYEMLNALKKIMNTRLEELKLSQSKYIGGQPNESRASNKQFE